MCRGAARGGTDPAGVRQKRGRRLRRCGVLVIRISVYGHRGCRGRWPADSGGRWHMSFVLAMPEVLGSAATDLAALGSVLGAADAAAAATTTGIVAAAQDEVSAAIAACFPPTAGPISGQCAGGGGSRPVRGGVEARVRGPTPARRPPARRCWQPGAERAAGPAGRRQCAKCRAHGAPVDRQRRQRGPGHGGQWCAGRVVAR